MFNPRIGTLAALLALGAVSFGQSVPSAETVMKEAQAIAAKEKKAVWVIFHASWCGWCKRLDVFIEDPANKKILEKYFVIRHLTVMESEDKKGLENTGGDVLMNELKGQQAGLPFFAFVGADGKMIENSKRKAKADDPGQNVGHPVAPEEIAWFMEMLTKGAPKMTKAERAALETWLKAQKIG